MKNDRISSKRRHRHSTVQHCAEVWLEQSYPTICANHRRYQLSVWSGLVEPNVLELRSAVLGPTEIVDPRLKRV